MSSYIIPLDAVAPIYIYFSFPKISTCIDRIVFIIILKIECTETGVGRIYVLVLSPNSKMIKI